MVDLNITVCPTCGSKQIKRVRRTLRRTFKGKPYTVPNLVFYACPDCGEKLYDHTAMQKIEAHSRAYAKKRRSA